MKTYLSIDLDYWNFLPRRSIIQFFRRVWALHFPIFVAPFHHQLVSHINQHECDTLINVDFHSDITEEERDLPLTEGTWVNFIKWQCQGTYIWRYSHPFCPTRNRGYCHLYINPFENKTVTHWRLVLKNQGLRGIPWSTIQAIGVCLSSRWIEQNPCVPIAKALGMQSWLQMDSIKQETEAKPFLRKATRCDAIRI